MSEKYLGEALLRAEAPVDAGAVTDRVLRRDRRRMWVVGVGCVAAWMAVVLLPLATVLPMAAEVAKHQAAQAAADRPAGTPAATARQEQSARLTEVLRRGTITTCVLGVGSMLLAAVSTVSLVVLSRRATLRQVNARLAELAAELRAGRSL